MLSTMVTILREFFVYHDFVDMAVGIFGDATSGGHPSVMTDLLDSLSSEELFQLVSFALASAKTYGGQPSAERGVHSSWR